MKNVKLWLFFRILSLSHNSKFNFNIQNSDIRVRILESWNWGQKSEKKNLRILDNSKKLLYSGPNPLLYKTDVNAA